eukprot:2263801-Amphidinium_carterae.1
MAAFLQWCGKDRSLYSYFFGLGIKRLAIELHLNHPMVTQTSYLVKEIAHFEHLPASHNYVFVKHIANIAYGGALGYLGCSSSRTHAALKDPLVLYVNEHIVVGECQQGKTRHAHFRAGFVWSLP